MLQLFPEHIEQIREEAVLAYPLEAAWLITKKGCTQVNNIAEDPENFFDIGERDIAAAHRDGLLAVVHSHTKSNPYPSEMDMRYQVNTDVPWGIVTCDGVSSSRILWWGGEQREDLLNRTFCHGVSDCFALMRDLYAEKYGIQVPIMPREWQWWEENKTFMEDGLEETGFVNIKSLPYPDDTPRVGDVWLASIGVRDGTLTHCGVLIENGLTHHHPGSGKPYDPSKKSVIEPINRYSKVIGMWVRHKELL